MPGHRIEDTDETQRDLERMIRLVEEHDCLFLLTDSRESRWMPALLGAAYDKIVITIGLGFDSYVAMRHGVNDQMPRLSCYFCNDVQAPGDTLSNRTLDQQCTVTRPGISYMAAAVGVELLAGILQHPQGGAAPATTTATPMDSLPSGSSNLGVLPHQIRGFLSHQQTMQLSGDAYRHCTACSQPIQQAIREDPMKFLMKALERADYAADVSGAKRKDVLEMVGKREGVSEMVGKREGVLVMIENMTLSDDDIITFESDNDCD